MMLRNVLLPAAVLAVSVLSAMLLWASRPTLEPQATEPMATTVRVLSVLPSQVSLRVRSQGSVAPRTESDLVPEVSGRVTWLSPDLVPGGYFEAGATLLRIDAADYENQVTRARAAFERAQAENEHARFEYERLKALRERQLASVSQAENAQRLARVAEASLAEAEAALWQAKRELDRTVVRAPFAGLLREKQIDVGQFVARGTPVARLYATDIVEVRLPVADEQLAYLDLPLGFHGALTPEQAPRVDLSMRFAGRDLHWQGHIARTEAEIDSKSRMLHMIARVDNEHAETPLSVGMFVQADIHGRTVDDIVSLPRDALRNGNQLLIVDDENRLRYREVELLRLQDDDVLISGGLAPGERVCISPLATVIDGMAVIAEETPRAPTSVGG